MVLSFCYHNSRRMATQSVLLAVSWVLMASAYAEMMPDTAPPPSLIPLSVAPSVADAGETQAVRPSQISPARIPWRQANDHLWRSEPTASAPGEAEKEEADPHAGHAPPGSSPTSVGPQPATSQQGHHNPDPAGHRHAGGQP